MIETMIVPTDGSAHADKAVELAADLAGKYGARLIILHALLHGETPVGLLTLCKRLDAPAELLVKIETESAQMVTTMGSAYAEVPVILPMSKALLVEIGELICARARDAATARGAASIEVNVVDGAAAENILAAAKHEKADMIVMGSRGLGRLEGFLLGAVSQRVNHLAECTCVTVK